MKYRYKFVNEVVEIDIDDKWKAVMRELDIREYLANRRETRRHESLDISKESEWCMSKDPTSDVIAEENEAAEKAIKKIENILTPKQFNTFFRVCIEGMTEKEYAKKMGVSQPVVHKCIHAALKKMMKIF